MKAATTLALLAGTAAAAPSLSTRQLGSTRNDLEDGNEAECPGVILIFARATGEAGNIVRRRTHSKPRTLGLVS